MRTLICEFQPFHIDEPDHYGRRGMEAAFRTGSPGKHYNYAYCGPKDVKKSDWALVHNGTNFGITEIKRVIPGIDPKVTKHVIDVLTRDEFKAYLERNAKIDELRSAMDELEYRLKEHKKLDKYKALAAEDPRAAELMKQVAEGLGINMNQLMAPASTEPAAAPSSGDE